MEDRRSSDGHKRRLNDQVKTLSEQYTDDYARALALGYNQVVAIAFAEIRRHSMNISEESALEYAETYGKELENSKVLAKSIGIHPHHLEEWSKAYTKCVSLGWTKERAKEYADNYLGAAIRAKLGIT